MRSEARHTQSGFTMLEVAITSVLVLLGLTVIAPLFGVSKTLSEHSSANARIMIEQCRNLDAIANVLHGVDLASLENFEPDGSSSNPHFVRVVGADFRERIYGPVEELRWVASNQPVSGVASPGAVYLLSPAGKRIVAKNVPADGFKVHVEGTRLVVSLSTYHHMIEDLPALVTHGQTALSVRN